MSDPRDDDRERRLEALLDATLRAMVRGEGPADLRQRVMARLDAPPRRSWWPAWTTAAVMAVLVAVAWLNPLPDRRRPVTPTASSTPVPAPAAPMASATAPPTIPTAERPRIRRPLPTEPADPSMPALPQPDPIAIAALSPPDIEIEPLSLDPLVVPHLAVEPLGEPEPERKD